MHELLSEIVKGIDIENSNEHLKIIDDLNTYIDSINCSNNELITKAINYYNNHKTELYLS